MVDPCLTDDCVDPGLIQRYNWFKWLILALLLLLLLLSLLRGCGAAQLVAPTLGVTATEMMAGEVELSGTGTPGSTVEILDGNASLGTAVVEPNGRWRLVAPLAAGAYALRAVVVDTDLSSPELSLNLFDTPTLELPGAEMEAGPLTLSGTGTPGSTVEIVNGGTVLGTAVVGNDGGWSFQADLPAGDYELAARVVDDGGAVIGQSAGQTLALTAGASTTTLAMPTFDGIDLNLPNFDPSFGVYQIRGSGEPGTMIELFQNGVSLGMTEVGGDGRWMYDVDGLMAGESYSFSARMLNGDGELLAESDPMTVDWPEIEMVETDAAGEIALGRISGGIRSFEPVVFSGTADGEMVEIIVDGQVVATVPVDSSGRWRYTGFFSAGDHEFEARSFDGDGVELAMLAVTPFTVGATTVSDPVPELSNDENGALRIFFVPPAAAEESDGGDNDGGGSDDDSASQIDVSFLEGSPAVELIIDASWSMTLDLTGETRLTADDPDSRIAIAQAALDELLNNSLPEGLPIAVRAFGNIEGDLSCRTDLMVALQPFEQENVADVVTDITPQFNANTALAAALSQVANDLAETDREKVVVLLTDGEETCGGDPAAAIQSLVDQGIDVKVNIIGFAIGDDRLRANFEEWARLGNGDYYDAQNANQLVEALQNTLIVRYRVVNEDNETLAVGIVGGSPIELPAGTYRVEILGSDQVIDNVTVLSGELLELVEERP